MGIMEIKAKIDKYFEEHPNVKKGLKIAGSLALTGASLYAGYKLGAIAKEHRSNDIYVPSEPAAPEIPTKPETPALPKPTSWGLDIPTVPNDETFDMIFRNSKTGEIVGVGDCCLGSYVNDTLPMFEDSNFPIVKGIIPVKDISTKEELDAFNERLNECLNEINEEVIKESD